MERESGRKYSFDLNFSLQKMYSIFISDDDVSGSDDGRERRRGRPNFFNWPTLRYAW